MSLLEQRLTKLAEKLGEKQYERLTSSLIDADSRIRHFKQGAASMIPIIVKLADRLDNIRLSDTHDEADYHSNAALKELEDFINKQGE